jgi:hypothetical protein
MPDMPSLTILVERDGKPGVQVDVDLREPPGPFESLNVGTTVSEFDSLVLSDAQALKDFLAELVRVQAGPVKTVCYGPRLATLRSLLVELGGKASDDPITVKLAG